MMKKMDHLNINDYLIGNRSFKNNHRIKNFKDFEKKFHANNSMYRFSNNESTYLYKDKDGLVGFLLVNDSWRCKSVKFKDEKALYFGSQQLNDGLRIFENNNTILNICLFHHSLENFEEKTIVEGILTRKNVELFLNGHFHSTNTHIFYNPYGTCHGFRSRATLFKPEEIMSEFQSGYQILDIDLVDYKITEIHYRKYNNKETAKLFISDVETAPENGIDRNKANHNTGFELYRENRVKKQHNFNKADFKS
ncbi:hypothetical protein D3C85_1074830 [compost metagenome]